MAERIEQPIRLGKIADSIEKKSFTEKMKEIEFHNIKGSYKGERKTTKTKTFRDQPSWR